MPFLFSLIVFLIVVGAILIPLRRRIARD